MPALEGLSVDVWTAVLTGAFFPTSWNGNGDVALTESQFAGILLCIKQKQILFLMDTFGVGDDLRPIGVSFYNTRYEKAFGYAVIYVGPDNRIVGFSDVYDFDSKRWGG